MSRIPREMPKWRRLRQAARLLPLAVPAMMLGWHRAGRLRHALRESRSELHATRQQLEAIVSRAPVGIVQTALDGRILLVNDRYCGLVGHAAEQLCTLRLQDLVHSVDRPQHDDRHAQMLETGEPFQIESRLVRSDESHVWVISHLAVTHDMAGRPMHVVAAVQDISHRRAAQAALEAMNASLEQRVAETVAERVAVQDSLRQAHRMEALGQLAGGVAHDFNNVLQAIAGGARLIQRRPNDPAAVERLAGLVVDAAERGAVVTQRLLSFAQCGPLQPGPVDTAALLHELGDILASTLSSRISVRVNAADELPPIMADRGQLETVLVNLAANARDAMTGIGLENGREDDPGEGMSEAGHTLRMSAAVAEGRTAGLPDGAFVRIDVADTGPGMDADVLERATEPFFTTKPRARGTGLGLAMARGFAEQSGGALLLQNRAGAGTTASLFLPVAGPVAKVAAGPGASKAAANDIGRRSRIALVDDDPEVLGVLSEVLTLAGYDVMKFDSAIAALAQVDDQSVPALLVTDLSMPGTDGLTLIRQMRQRWPDLPSILLSGYGGDELARAAEQLSGAPLTLLQKPVRSAELTRQIAALLLPPALSA